MKMIRNRFSLIVLIIIFSFPGCLSEKKIIHTGKTMGTQWRVTFIAKTLFLKPDFKNEIDLRLDEINRSMSLFDTSSELSAFNSIETPKDSVCVSDDFLNVFKTGKRLYRLTDGAWDATIGPLVNLWGFGNKGREVTKPDSERISIIHASTGYHHVIRTGSNCLTKNVKELVLDFGSIAKGYAVDEIVFLMKQKGYTNCLVEIGGEVFASGTKTGKPWRIGINTPSPEASPAQVYKALTLKDKAIATSGDYRNFRIIDGKTYSHVINPKTGWPVTNTVASVSVIADTTMFADGLATALMVMGYGKGIDLVEALDGIECLIIVRNQDGSFTEHMSKGFKSFFF